MLDLIAITAGVLAFLSWSVATFTSGYLVRRRQQQREWRKAAERMLAEARATKAPAKREPRPTPDAATIRRSQA